MHKKNTQVYLTLSTRSVKMLPKQKIRRSLRLLILNASRFFNDKLAMIAKVARKEKNFKKRKDMWKNFFALKSFFADVKYTFASTIHKLQGST